MSNAMKLFVRSLVILVFFIIGSWLNTQLGQSVYNITGSLGYVSLVVMYIVYFFIGITIGTMVSPRFSKNRGKGVHLIPIIIFVIIGAQWFFSPFFTFASLPWGIGNHLLEYANLSWTIVGIFTNQLFR